MDEQKTYRPLNQEEQEILQRKVKLFNSISYTLRKDIEQYGIEINRNTWKLKSLEEGEAEYDNTVLKIKGYTKMIRASEIVIKKTRPHTPQGRKICHICDIIGMTLLEKQADRGFDKLKCQNPKCNAEYNDTSQYIHAF
jgi:hypothetical protein